MDITPYVDHLRQDLIAAAEAGGDDLKAAAERLALCIDPATRLALMEALTDAAAEITCELPAGSVEVRLRGREPQFVVDVPAPAPAPLAPPAPPSPEPLTEDEDDDGAVARITLRLPESVKTRAEEMATRSGQSLNTWLVNAVKGATRDRAINVDIDLSSMPFFERGSASHPRGPGKNRRMTGWV